MLYAAVKLRDITCPELHCCKQVWKARVKATGEDVAVKLLDLENLNCSLVGHQMKVFA